MDEIQLVLDESGKGAFAIDENNKRVAEMQIAIKGANITVFHTEVSPELQGKGVAAKLLAHLVSYARQHRLKVIALCPYVSAQFRRHPEQYADVWNRDWHHQP